MPRYAPVMPQADLRQLLINLAIQNDHVEEYGDIDPAHPNMDRIVYHLHGENHLPSVCSDWAKIDFDTENMDVQGERTTQDGIPYLEIRAGGDWEHPLVAIIYHDGKTFRGFVPRDGNTYNYAEKSAFGNNDSDADAAKKQFNYTGDMDYLSVDPDVTKITSEINSRLTARGTYSVSTAPVISAATKKAEVQKVIEMESKEDLSGDITPDMVYAVIRRAGGCAYVHFELRSSRRELTNEESNRIVGIPTALDKNVVSGRILWYSPMGVYPVAAYEMLQRAGFEKAPDNDLSMYANSRTEIIFL